MPDYLLTEDPFHWVLENGEGWELESSEPSRSLRNIDLNAVNHIHTLAGLQRFRIEILDMPVGDEGDRILLEDGDDLLTELSEFLVSDGSAETKLTYKLAAEPHNYVLDALARQVSLPYDSYAQAVVPPVAPPMTVTTFDVSFGWAYATTVPVNALSATGYAPTVAKTEDYLTQEDGDILYQEDGSSLILVDI